MEETRYILEMRHVTGKGRKFHLKDVSLQVEPGYIYGLAGENGAGKTTLLQTIMKEKKRYKGEILVDGLETTAHHVEIMNRIGYVSEDRKFLLDRTGEQNAEILGMLYTEFDMERFLEAMQRVEVSPYTTYKLLSRGEKLKFQLAFAMAYRPHLYLLDEVTAGMDPAFRLELFGILQELIQDESCSVLMTTHILSEMQKKTDYAGMLVDGVFGGFVESLDFAKEV